MVLKEYGTDWLTYALYAVSATNVPEPVRLGHGGRPGTGRPAAERLDPPGRDLRRRDAEALCQRHAWCAAWPTPSRSPPRPAASDRRQLDLGRVLQGPHRRHPRLQPRAQPGARSRPTATRRSAGRRTRPRRASPSPLRPPGPRSSGTVQVTANASDDTGVTGVQFKLDGQNLGGEDTTAPYSVSWNTTQATNGPHSLTAVARDARRQHQDLERGERDREQRPAPAAAPRRPGSSPPTASTRRAARPWSTPPRRGTPARSPAPPGRPPAATAARSHSTG